MWEWLSASSSWLSASETQHAASPQLASVPNGARTESDASINSSSGEIEHEIEPERDDERDHAIFFVEMVSDQPGGHTSWTHGDTAFCARASSPRPVERQTSPGVITSASPLSACETLEKLERRSVSPAAHEEETKAEAPDADIRNVVTLRGALGGRHISDAGGVAGVSIMSGRPTIDMRLERDLRQAKANARFNQFDPLQRPNRPVPQVFFFFFTTRKPQVE